MATPTNPQRAHAGLGLLPVVLLLVAPLALLVYLLLPQFLAEEQPVTAMVAANALYTSGQFDLAAQAYAQLEDQGYGGQALLTNHGLALLEAGQLQKAAALLSTAQEQYPRDETIRAALAEVERLAGTDSADAPATAGPAAQRAADLGRLRPEWLSNDQIAALALLLWTGIAALSLAAVRLPQRGARQAAAVLAGIGIVLLLGVLAAVFGG